LSKSAKFLKNPVYVYQSKKSQAQVDFEQEMKQTMQKFPNMRVELRYQEVDEAAEKLAARPPLLSKQHRGSPYNIKTKVSKPSTFQDDNKRRSAGLTSAAHLFGANSPMSSNSASSNKQQYPKFIKVK
jgi:primosomal protein N''